MLYLSLSLPIHGPEVPYLDEDARSDLVNRFGRKLLWLLSLPPQQKFDVLGCCKKGGHIRWHHLVTDEEVLSSDFRAGCLNTYEVWVGIEEPGAGVVAMDATDLRKFTQAFGVDLDEIRKLGQEEMECLFGWLRDASMIEWFLLQYQMLSILTRLNPWVCLPVHITSFPLFFHLTLGSAHPVGNYNLTPSWNANAGDEFDCLLEQSDSFLEQYNPTAELPHTVSPQQEPVTPPQFSAEASSYPTPLSSVSSPPRGQPLSPPAPGHGQVRYQFVHSPPSTDSPFTASSYPTPVTSSINSPRGDEPMAPLDSNVSSQTKRQLLHSCRFGEDGNGSLEDKQITSTLRAEAGLHLDNCTRLLQPLLDDREDDPPALEALGLPLQWRGLEGAVIYYRMLEAAKKKSNLSLLAKRIAQILFYLNYRWLEKHETGSSKSVATLILNACPEEPKDPKLMKPRRDNITGYHKRRGERWWLHAACLGPGVLTHAPGIMETEIITSSKKEKVQVFISLILRVRPGSVNFFGRWAPVLKAIALGAPTSELRQILEASNADTVRQAELACAYESDQEALSRQQIGETWMAIDVESIAEKKIAEFLPGY